MNRRSTTMATHFKGYPKFQDNVLTYFINTREKLEAFLRTNTYLDPTVSNDKDCFEFCICFAQELCRWTDDGAKNGSLIKEINAKCASYRNKCFASRDVPSFAKKAKELLDSIVAIEQERIAIEQERMRISDMQHRIDDLQQHNNMVFSLKSTIKSVIKVIIAALLGISVMYIIHLKIIREVSTDPLYQEFDAKASELSQIRSLYSKISDKILLPTHGNSNIISDAEMGRITDENIITLGASIFVASQQIIDQHLSMLVQTSDNQCFEVKWTTSKQMMQKIHDILKNEAVFKLSNKKIRLLPKYLPPETKLSMKQTIEELTDYETNDVVDSLSLTNITNDPSYLDDDTSKSITIGQSLIMKDSDGRHPYILPQQYFNNLNNLLDNAWKTGNEKQINLFAKHWRILYDAFNYEKNTLFFLSAVDPESKEIQATCEILKLSKKDKKEDIRHYLEAQREKQDFGKKWPKAKQVFDDEKWLKEMKEMLNILAMIKALYELPNNIRNINLWRAEQHIHKLRKI